MKARMWTLIIMLVGMASMLSAQLLTEGFEEAWPPAGWQILNAGAGNEWTRLNSPIHSSEGANCMLYGYSSTQAANTWAISVGVPMVAGRNYRIEFYQKVLSASYPEYLKVTLGRAQTVAAQTITLLNYPLPGLTNESYINRVSPEYLCLETGTYYIGFQCYSRRDMYDLFVDNVRFYETILNEAPSPAVCVAPLDDAVSVMNDASLNWLPNSGNVNGYRISLGTNNPPTNIINDQIIGNVTSYTPGGLLYNIEYFWQVVPYNETGQAADCPVWSFTTGANPTVNTFPYAESFDLSVPPYGWHSNAVVGARNWAQYAITPAYPQSVPHTGAGMAGYNINGAGNGSYAIMVSPPITANAELNDYSLQLWVLRELILPEYADVVNIYYSTAPDMLHAPTALASIHRNMYLSPVSEAPAGWHLTALNDLPFTTGSNNYIIISATSRSGNSLYVDDLLITSIPLPVPPLPSTVVSPLDNAVNVPLNTDYTWAASDGATGYYFYLGTNNPPNNLVNGITLGNVTTYNPVNDLSMNSVYYWRIVPFSGNGSAVNCPVWTFSTPVLPAITDFPYVTDFTQFLPGGWTLDGDGQVNWGTQIGTTCGGEWPEAVLSWTPQFTGISRLVTPNLNTLGMTALRMKFKMYYNHFTNIYTIGVATRHALGAWTTIWSHSNSTMGPVEIPLVIDNADINSPTTQVCFYTSGNSYNMNYWLLDDVVFEIDALAAPQNPLIELNEAGIQISWDAVAGAGSYCVWKCADPLAEFDPIAQINWHKVVPDPILGTFMTLEPAAEKEFYRITARP